MKIKELDFKEDKGSSMASRVIRNYAREIGADSMDYGMFMKSADLLDKDMLKSLALHIEKSDTAPREYVMKKIADHNPEIFKKMYGDQEGYLSIMKPQKDLTDDESVKEDAPFGSGMELLRMAIMRKFITVQEWDLLKHKWKEAAAEVEEKYSDWPEGEGFGSSDHNFAIRDLMTAVGYEFDDQDTSGRFVVTKQPEEIEKAGIKNARMKGQPVAQESEPSADAERADAARGMWASSKEIQSRFKTWQDFMNSEDFDEWLDDKFRDEIGEDEELNRITKLAGLGEGADFYGYYKDPKDPEGKTFTYPNNMEFKTPHRSNANARMLLSRIGLDPDFENTGSHLIDDFIAATDKYLRMNVSDKDTNEYDEVEMYHVEANRIKKTHPEVTHVGFN